MSSQATASRLAPSSRPGTASPTKRGSAQSPTTATIMTTTELNPSLPRPPSIPSLSGRMSPTKLSASRPSSPTKVRKNVTQQQVQSASLIRPPSTSFTSNRPSTSSLSTLNGLGSRATIPLPLGRPSSKSGAGRGKHSSDDPETSAPSVEQSADESGFEDEESDSDKPVRRGEFSRAKLLEERKAASSTGSEYGRAASRAGQTTEEERDDDDVDGKAENVVVCLRVRPTRKSQTAAIYNLLPSLSTISLTSAHPTLLKRGGVSSKDEYEFRFDKLHLSPSPTVELFESKIKPVVRAAMKGFNGTVFAYGQTASGKTHTMMGTPEEPGIIPLAITELFEFIHAQHTHRTFTLRVSLLEIYNESIRDLLSPLSSTTSSFAPPKPLEITGDNGGSIRNLTERPVSLPEDVLDAVDEGNQRRRTAGTDWNERSSRGHVVFQVTVESSDKLGGEARTSRLNLIDLAGSEAATNQEERRKEGSFINKSLLTLGTVIGKLSDKSSAAQHIPYRDSKLTRLLQPALSGNSRVAVICTISPDIEQATETLSTLRFAKRAKMVVTKAERGVIKTDQLMWKVHADEVAKLQAAMDSVLKEKDSMVDELNAHRKTQEELARTKLELEQVELKHAALRDQHDRQKSFMLTGPVIEANSRRASGQFPGMTPGGKSRRIFSEMSGLGIGSPLSSRQRLASLEEKVLPPPSGPTTEEIALRSRLDDAERQLAEASAGQEEELLSLREKLARSESASNLARSEVAKAIQASADRKQKLIDLQRDNQILRDDLADAVRKVELNATAAGKVTELEAKVSRLEKTIQQVEADSKLSSTSSSSQLTEARTQLVTTKEESIQLQADLNESRKTCKDTLAQLRKAEKSLADSRAADTRDEQISTLEREVARLQKEKESVAASTKATLLEAQDKFATASSQQQAAAERSLQGAAAHLAQVEASYRKSRHELEQRQDAEAKLAEAEISRLSKELALALARISELETALEVHRQLDLQRQAWNVNSKAGTDALKSRLAGMQARVNSTPGSSTSTRTSTSSLQSSVGRDLEATVELQVRNDELVARVADLETQLRERSRSGTPLPSATSSFINRKKSSQDLTRSSSSSSDLSIKSLKEKERLTSIIESQKDMLAKSHASCDEWRDRYLAVQSELERATRLTLENRHPLPPSPPRPSLADLNLPSSYDRTPTDHSTPKSSSHLRTQSASAYIHTNKNVPPPLPYSPHHQEKERKLRRETITKEMAKLREAKGVEKTREILNSPQPSPTKMDSPKVGTATWGKKGSTDSARLWS